jgi:hypothetical protein
VKEKSGQKKQKDCSFFCSAGVIAVLLCFIFILFPSVKISAQINPEPVARQAIDAKRANLNYFDNDALYSGREYVRMDSTYYVGYMYEGTFEYDRAEDFMGFKMAIPFLRKAFLLLERDYASALRTHTTSPVVFMQIAPRWQDYVVITQCLMDCYSNTDQPDSVISLMNQYKQWHFQRDFLGADTYIAWTYHRNRFYTHKQYPFLKNSIAANEKTALGYLYHALNVIDQNAPINDQLFQPSSLAEDKDRVYHYLALIYSYELKIDSAAYYYNLMRYSPLFSYNNYASFLLSIGDLQGAYSNYSIAQKTDYGDKRLKESNYYLSILDTYRGDSREGIDMLKQVIQQNGSTPGYGWYNIALARSYLYNGQLDSCDFFANKAANFHEVNIGTTLGQTQYDFSIAILRLIDIEDQIAALKFEHPYYWLSFSDLQKLSTLVTQKYTQLFLLISQFAMDPERNLVIYKLFSTESTVSFDEVWYLVKDISPHFFLQKFKDELQTDNRPLILKYYKLFLARLELKEGNIFKARNYLQDIFEQETLDGRMDKLFLGRAYETYAACEKASGNKDECDDYMMRLYTIYPQLVPFSNLSIQMNLQITGNNSAATQKIVNELKNSAVNWVNETGADIPVATIHFYREANTDVVQYEVKSNDGKTMVQEQFFPYKDPGEAGTELLFRLFNIGGKG